MHSLWHDGAPRNRLTRGRLDSHTTYDAVVVGAGLTGLTTALLLARAGRSVAVLESDRVGALASGSSTGKVSLLQGGVLSNIQSSTSDALLNAYVEANREGKSWLLRYAADRGVSFERRDAYTFSATAKGAQRLSDELEACRAAGLDVDYCPDIRLPGRPVSGIRMKDQAQLDPVAVLEVMAADLRNHGGIICEGTRVLSVGSHHGNVLHTSRGDVHGLHVVVATGTPILDRGLTFAKLRPSRSYLQAYPVPHDVDAGLLGMYLSVDSPSRSLRSARWRGQDMLIAGGSSHSVGDPTRGFNPHEEIDRWVQSWFPGVQPTHAWSAQDYSSVDALPLVGPLPRTGGSVWFATGFNKWGMTNAVAAALSLSADILGDSLPWAEELYQRPVTVRSVAATVGLNARVGARQLSSWGRTLCRPTRDFRPAEGQGQVERSHGLPTASSTLAGESRSVSAVCPHLGGILEWNTTEGSWDCPLHGSRFDASGKRLEGPATKDLSDRE